jgi:hypothetical protein
LLPELILGCRLTDLLSERTRHCPQTNQAGVRRTFSAVIPNLLDLQSDYQSLTTPGALKGLDRWTP